MEVEDLSARRENASGPELPAGGDTPAMQLEVLAYFAILNVAIGLGSPVGFASIPIASSLKTSLHLSPARLAIFLAIASIPVCAGFAFGFIRDRWRNARW